MDPAPKANRPCQSMEAPPSKRRRASDEVAASGGEQGGKPGSAALRVLIPPRESLRRARPSLLENDDSDGVGDDAAKKGSASSAKEGSAAVAAAAAGHKEQPPRCDWPAVIARAVAYPHEAQEPHFGPCGGGEGLATDQSILAYKPLHAMLKYDPPLAAVEAVLRAHPAAAVGMTFEGTALQIASCSGATNMLVLRLLLVAEMAVRKRMCEQRDGGVAGRKRPPETLKPDANEDSEGKSAKHVRFQDPPDPEAVAREDEGDMFTGNNPISWITDANIPVQTAAMLLKWYPIGAFQRPCNNHSIALNALEEGAERDSPLIEIVDEFATDGAEGDDASDGSEPKPRADPAEDTAGDTQQPQRSMQTEVRWEKFLHILYATDSALEAMRQPASSLERDGSSSAATSAMAQDSATHTTASAPLKSESSCDTPKKPTAPLPEAPPTNPFRPVHAWVRCLTAPFLGLERCRPYAAWAVLREMGRRIPSEFAGRDANDGNRTAFQILAESPASDCRLGDAEIRDVVECLIEADHRSAFLPRSSDGRLIGHVALENGWPCKDLFSRKKSATCA
ncbi:hypothetical protein ACHAXT_011565 [Thalassiosira profunda]